MIFKDWTRGGERVIRIKSDSNPTQSIHQASHCYAQRHIVTKE